MKTIILASLFISSISFAAKGYQVTGPVMEVGKDSITVQKGKETWVLQTSPTTKGLGGVKAGDKVTIYYSMNAEEIENKGSATEKPAKAEKPAKKK
jgi:hypothetical protein